MTEEQATTTPPSGSALIEDGDHDLYAAAAEHFPLEAHKEDLRGGAKITYLEGEDIISRMNKVFVYGWECTVMDDGINEDADECWVRARVTIWRKAMTRAVTVDELSGSDKPTKTVTTYTESLVPISREQYGSQKLKRARSTGKILDIGFDKKGALTDAIKKTVSLFGVGLYLWNKEERALIQATSQDVANEQRQQARTNNQGNQPPRNNQGAAPQQLTDGQQASRFRRPARPAGTQGQGDPQPPAIVIPPMPEGFEQPFALVEQGKSQNQCRVEQCDEVLDPNGDYTIGGETKKGGYVVKRSREMAGCIMCVPHTATWHRAMQKAIQHAA